MSASLTPSMLPDAAAMWRSAIEDISPHASPCRYLAPARWNALREAALAFCDEHGPEAHWLGWTAPELFALHSEHGTLRIECCGVLMITGNRAQGVEATRILFERGSAYRTKPGQEWGVPVWVFAKKGAGR